MKTRCRFERAIESLKTSVHESGKKGYTTLLAAGIVNPFGPTLSVLAVDGYFPLADGRIPLIEMMLNPFAQSCTIVGTVDMGDNWTPLYDLQPFTSLPLRSCPTLLLPSQFMAPDTVESLYADLLMTFDHGDRVLSSVRQYPGDPWTRIQAEIDDSLSGETSGSPFAPPKSGTSRLNRSEATELARTQLAPENLRRGGSGVSRCLAGFRRVSGSGGSEHSDAFRPVPGHFCAARNELFGPRQIQLNSSSECL